VRALIYAAMIGSCYLAGCVQRGDVLTRDSDKYDASMATLGTDVSCGDAHAGAIIDGTAYFWGQNDQGQLGLGNTQNQARPLPILGSKAWRQVASGSEHSCGLDTSGQVYCWGDNSRGQLAQNDRDSRLTPFAVPLPQPATQLSTKFNHTCALLINAALYCWGQNDEGQLGQSDQPPAGDTTANDALNPVRVGTANWRVVDTGQGHTCAISLDGSLFCWGRNSDHELGADSRIQVREPIQVLPAGPWLDVAGGQNHTCGIMQDFTLWCWGANTGTDANGGPLGHAALQLASPTQVGTAADWTRVHTNTFHSCALNQSAEMWCWGRNAEGQLGTSDVDSRTTPVRVASNITAVGTGRFMTCAVNRAGIVACTGANDVGELGTGDTDRRNVLTPVSPGVP